MLPTIAQPNEPLIVRYDPRDLSHLFVMGKDLRYHSVPYANVTHPPISMAELRHLQAQLRAQSKAHIDENLLFATHDKQQKIVAAAMTTTKATRRRAEAARRSKAEKQPLVSSIDFTKEADSLPAEIWENPL
jgi:putative transposase